MSYYPLPTGFFRDNLQHWLRDFASLLKVQFTSNEGMSNDAPIHECESEIDHYTGHQLIYDNEFVTKENKNYSRVKLNCNTYIYILHLKTLNTDNIYIKRS